jgi:hypothetical protein
MPDAVSAVVRGLSDAIPAARADQLPRALSSIYRRARIPHAAVPANGCRDRRSVSRKFK